MIRLFFDIFLFFCAVFLPWWLALFVGAIGLFAFPYFYEMLFLGVIIDSIYTPADPENFKFECIATLSALILFIVVELLKRSLRFYNKGRLSL